MFLDTNILIDMLLSREETVRFQRIIEVIENERLYVSIFQIGELSDWCFMAELDPLESIMRLKEVASIIPLTESICINASRIKDDMRKKGAFKFGLGDGIVLASARSINQELLTTDRDFEEAEDAIIL